MKLFRLARYMKWTLQTAFDHFEISHELQAMLSAYQMIFGEQQQTLSFHTYVYGTMMYHRGAYYPKKGIHSIVDSLQNIITTNGGEVLTSKKVVQVTTNKKSVQCVETENGDRYHADIFICNIDPKTFNNMIGNEQKVCKLPAYPYSTSFTNIFLEVEGLNLRTYGFGNWNVWYRPALEIPANMYNSDPCEPPKEFYINSPSEVMGNTSARSTLSICIPSNYEKFKQAMDVSKEAYEELKRKHTEIALETIEKRFKMNLCEHIRYKEVWTPIDCQKMLLAPQGAALGKAFSPASCTIRLPRKSLENLYFVGQFVSFAGVANVINNACKVYEDITSETI